jgi:serine/threonine-protein kinase
MEYVSGPALRAQLTPDRPWPIPRALAVLDRIARALSYIHDQGILHLDLKPENVLCMPDGGIKITDFGLALRRVDARTLSEMGLAQGTIDYSSPEQRYGLPIDQRSDLFSLAVLAYELFTGHLPGRVFVSACQSNAELPAAADPVLRQGLARDPDERYATVEEFRRDLAAALNQSRSDSGFWVLM